MTEDYRGELVGASVDPKDIPNFKSSIATNLIMVSKNFVEKS